MIYKQAVIFMLSDLFCTAAEVQGQYEYSSHIVDTTLCRSPSKFVLLERPSFIRHII